jgi:carboxypeptidase C (cathepsin A)
LYHKKVTVSPLPTLRQLASFMKQVEEFARSKFAAAKTTTGAQTKTQSTLYTAGDLAASMELNPYLKVFCANGYYDAVTPFFQTMLDLEKMPLGNPKSRDKILGNLVFRTYRSGHMIYLHKDSRKEMKRDLGAFYDRASEPYRSPNKPIP